IGDAGGTWFDASNWSNGAVPTSNTDLTINTLVIVDQPGAVAHSLNIEDGASLSIFAGSLDTPALNVHLGGMLMLDDPAAVVHAEMLAIADGGSLVWNAGAIAGAIVNSGSIELGDPIAQLTLEGSFSQSITGQLA